jgi:flavin reductase
VTFDPVLQRRIMGRFATGVTVITARWGDVAWGMTANGVLSLSLNPPRVLVSVRCDNYMHACLANGMCFAINVLDAESEAVARRFAVRGPKDFAGLQVTTAATGAPILEQAVAYVDCQVVERLRGGDHDMFVGQPLAGAVRDGPPLLFYAGRYRALVPLAPDEELAVDGDALPTDSYDLYGCF